MFVLEFDACDPRESKNARRALLHYLTQETENGHNLVPVEEIYSELIANVCKHADRWARVSITWRRDTPILEVLDRGPGLDLSQWRPPQELAEQGRGLVIVSGLCRDVTIRPGPDGSGTRVAAVLPLRRRLFAA